MIEMIERERYVLQNDRDDRERDTSYRMIEMIERGIRVIE